MTNPYTDTIILAGDCKQTLKAIRSETVDLIVSSPPYGNQKRYGTTREKKQPLQDYLAEMRPVLTELYRVLKNTSSLCWQVGNRFQRNGEIVPLDIPYYQLFKELGFALRNRIVWTFQHGLTGTKRLSGRYECVLWFSKSDDYVFCVDQIRVPQIYLAKKHSKGLNYGLLSSHPMGQNPGDYWDLGLIEQDWEELVWNVPNVKSRHVETTSHPCQFPTELIQRLIVALTNEGDCILDPLGGAGTSAVAALTLNRKAILCEMNPATSRSPKSG